MPDARHASRLGGVEMTLETRSLTKRYGTTVAVDALSIVAQPGRVTALLGPNGAGKTTTMRLLLGLTGADTGEALIGGRRYAAIDRPMTVVGALLDAAAAHPGRSARDHLRWLAQSNGIPRWRVPEVIQTVGLSDTARRRVGTFSLGMRQRLGLAAALLGDPPILILDEPTIGLDPEGIHWMRQTLRGFAAEGRTVVISSHLMSELEGTADCLVIIGRGRLLTDASVDDFIAAASEDRVEIVTHDASTAMTVLANAGATVISTRRERLTISGLTAGRVSELFASHQLSLDALTPGRATLEEAYFRLTRRAEANAAASSVRAGTAS
jgi:ABC-2 type transport system ATP-binding protein